MLLKRTAMIIPIPENKFIFDHAKAPKNDDCERRRIGLILRRSRSSIFGSFRIGQI